MTGLQVGDDASLIVLVDASSDTERRLVEAALAEQVSGRAATVLPLGGAGLAGPLEGAAPDTVVTAVRVAWTRASRSGTRTPGRAGVAGRRRCPRCAGVRRGRCSGWRCTASPTAPVVVAEPATVAELAGRWEGTGSLAEFVARQAALALDRAERGVVGDRDKVPRRIVEAIEAQPGVPPRGRRARRAAGAAPRRRSAAGPTADLRRARRRR